MTNIKLITLIHVATSYFLIALSQNNILSLFQILMMQLQNRLVVIFLSLFQFYKNRYMTWKEGVCYPSFSDMSRLVSHFLFQVLSFGGARHYKKISTLENQNRANSPKLTSLSILNSSILFSTLSLILYLNSRNQVFLLQLRLLYPM